MAMDLNFSQESFAFSDIAPPSHVSGLESFSDFDASECSEASFAEVVVNKNGEDKDGLDFQGNDAPQPVSSLERSKESSTNERLSLGLEGLNANNINEFFEAIQNAESLGIISSSNYSGKSLAADESSLGILQLDGLPEFGESLSSNALEQASLPQDRTLVGDDENEDEIVINHYDTSSNLQGDDIPFTRELSDAGNLTPLANRNTGTVVQFEEERPDTGQDPDTFFSSHNRQVEEVNDDTANEPTNEEPIRYSYGQEELDMMLQGRSGSGDGGELIDRVSLTSSISFIQSQTFPESIFSQSFSSRGLGSGMDSRSESDGHEDSDDNTLPLLHGAGDGSNSSSTGRPGLEGGNSDAEDLATMNRVPLDASSRLEAQGLELRQSAEGVDVLPDVLGDGGGGGDGSSGNNSDADDGGPAGAAYASSSANALPSSTFPPTIASFGFIHQPAAADIKNNSALLDTDGLTAGRGCPVGDAAADKSPVLLPSPPEQRNELQDSLGTPHPLHFQASSTPLVRQEYNSRNVHDETSALESYYLMGHNAPRGSDTIANTPHAPWGDDSTFNMSQLQGNRPSNRLTEAESLNFDPHAGDLASGNQDRDMTLIPHDMGLEDQNIQHQGSDIWHGERSASSAALSNQSSEFSIKFKSSTFINGSTDIDESQMWKSTPRDDDGAAMRATPGVVFQGHQRPSTVTGQVADYKQSNSATRERSSGGEQSTVVGMLVDISSGQPLIEQPHDRTLTPERIMGDFTAQELQVNEGGRSSAFPWQDNEQDPFSTEGGRENAPASSLQAASMDQLSWPFGGDFVPGMNPFDGKNGTQESWMMPDCEFEPQGDALAVIDADEQIFNKEHELEIPSQISDTSKLHDWTIPDSHFVTRPSLLKVVGINDPNGTGEVRISVGAFFAAGSHELGSLSQTSPNRPRPHFGDEKPILTPSPRGAQKLISETATPSDPFLLDNNSPEDFSDRQTAVGGIKEVAQKPSMSLDEVSQRPQIKEQLKRKEIPGEEARNLNNTTTQLPASLRTDMLSIEMQKLKMDEQFKGDVPIKRRSRSASQTSSSSTGSIQSVIKKSDGQSTQPGRSVNSSDRSRTKERKRSHRKETQKSQNKTKQPLDVSLRSPTNSEQKFEEYNIHKDKMPFLRRSSYGDASSTSSLEKMTQFIAQAINEDPDEIRKKLAAVEKKKTKVKSKRKQGTPSEDQTASSGSRTSEFNPLASSSPQRHTSPEKMTYSQTNLQESQEHTISDSPNKLSSYTVEDSVFPSEDATSMVPLSLQELDSRDVSSQWQLMPSPEARSFHHIIPEFGETYTVRRAKKLADQQVPMIDPRKHRTHEIEQRLNRSLPHNMDSSTARDGHFPHPLPIEKPYPSNQEMTTSKSDFAPLEASDSAVGSMPTVLTQDNTNTRHSWPEATPSQQHKQKTFSKLDHVSGNTSQQSSNTKVDETTTHAGPSENFRAPVQLDNIGERPPSNVLMHGHHTGNLANQDFAQIGAPLTIAQGMAPFGNLGTSPHLYPSNNINGPVGRPGMMGPILGGNSFNLPMHGPLSNTAPTTYGPRMVPLGSTVYPPQGFATMNTFHGHVPFVQTVSASMGPKPSSLTPTYVQSLNVDIPPNVANQQIPLNLRTNTSNMSDLPSSFTHPSVSMSMPYQHTPPQQMPNGLLQVRSDIFQGAVMPSTQEIIPGEIKFPPFCCVGVLTESVIPLHNSSSRWMHCEIHFILSTANGVQVPSSASAFSLQSKAIIAPHTTENVRISIEPVESGTYTAQLQVYSFPVVCDIQPVAHSLGPVLALEVVAEEPRVEILLEDENTINFGEVSWGAKQCRPIHLVNRGRAQVPIRLIISANSSSLHCFGFADADFSPKAGIRNLSSAKGATLTIHTLTLKGRKDPASKVEPTVVLLLFQSPKMGLHSSSSAAPAEEYIARLDVEIDSARQGPTISSVALKAIEGLVRLHTPHKLQVLTLKSSVGKSTSCTIPVKNAGNITARVKLKIEGDSQQFSVKPAQLHLKPEEESVVQVVYQPTEANKQVQSLVVLAVPNGPVYELVVKGSAVPKEEDKFTLLSSKPVLSWSGVALGWSQRQKVVLKTSSTSPVKLQLMIEGNHSDFQIQPTFSSHGGSPEHHQATLEPMKELPVHVSFSPSSMGLISSSLVIKSLAGKANSKIPLYGCGGTSQLVLVDIRQLSEGYVLNIGEVSLGRKNTVKVKLRNSGTRAAFVKVVCYSDVHLLQRYPSTHLNVTPNSFILSERTSKTVLIEYQPLERDAIKCRTSVNSVAAVAFYTGDEFLRRQYKRNLQRNPQHFSSEIRENGPLAGIDFTSTFQDEDKLVEDVKYPKVASWDTFFQGSVSRVLLTLVGSPPSSNLVNKNDPNRSVDIAPVSDKPAAMPHLPSPVTNGNPDEKSWSVIPDFLTMTPCKSKDDKSGKSADQLRIVNFSERSLGFEFTWPGHAIVITPERGEIPPRSQTKVFVSAKPNPANSFTHLPWGGTIYLNCDGVQQSIRVQIREEQVLESSPLQSGTVSFQSIPTTAAGGTPLPSNHLPPLRIKNKDVVFETTLIGTVTTSEIFLTNTASSDMTWNLSSVAPAYVKVDDTGSIHRTTYNAFSIRKLSGSVQGHGTAQILVKFQPRDVGEYEQSWDLMTSSSSKSEKQKIFLHGQAVQKSEGQLEDANIALQAKTKKVTIKEPSTSTVGDKKGLYVTESILQFPVTTVGSISEAKVKICNGSGEIQYLARIASLTKPFGVHNNKFTVRPGRFVRLPVVFSPTEPNKLFEASLVITADPDAIISVKLQGSSEE